MDPNKTPYYELPLLGLDAETDGVDVRENHVITFNITYSMSPDHEPEQFEKHDWLLKPVAPIPEGASAVHGITTDYAQQHGEDPRQALQGIHDHLAAWESYGLPLVAYNAAYDCSLLMYEWQRHGIESKVTFRRVIDPFVLDKQGFKYRPGKRNLTRLAEIYDIKLENAHSADADVLATLMLARRIPYAAPKLKLDRPIDNIHKDQVKWKAEQSASLQEYFRGKGGKPEAVVNGEWPVVYGDTGN